MNFDIEQKKEKYTIILEMDREEFNTLESDCYRIGDNNCWWLDFDWDEILTQIKKWREIYEI